jgi:uncharacterized protein (DUF427 family)
VRAVVAGETVIDTTDALLVWEPRRVTPTFAVPPAAVRGRIVDTGAPRELTPREAARPVLDPRVPFDAHTAPGRTVRIETTAGPIAAFEADDPDVGGRLLVDFAAADWFEEDDPVASHPHDPFKRIDVRRSSRHVLMSVDGVPVVETRRARMLQETGLPMRWYVPPEDVLVPLEASDTLTVCAYKGRATHRSVRLGERLVRDLSWEYEHPLPDGRDVLGLIGFYAERMDVTVDGRRIPRRGMEPPPGAAGPASVKR